ncbi:zinc finger RNA-binding protein isoform X2 [Nematostella vectensis]|uniref:zinc finger RNA-binding protein isoform X2 n=1 Tax=Nematostella vectensis TaxID=45351 RepID=UPI0020771E55|nr:zinc finger RNA-binding protein isoform X2 [Nematostella vectensis]
MAASNYYVYTSGAQHSQGFTTVQNPPIQTSYTAPQASTGYAVQGTAPTAAHYGPPQTQRPVVQPAYSAGTTAYAQSAPSQGSGYGYTARQQDAPPPPPPTNTSYQAATYQPHHGTQTFYERDAYDTSKSYYSQPQTSSVPASQGGYYAQGAAASAKAVYQSTVATGYGTTPASVSPAVAKSHPYTSSSTVAYPYSSYSTSRTHANYNNPANYSSAASYGGAAVAGGYHPQAYEAAVYNAAAAYVQQQHTPSRPNWKSKSPGGGGGTMAMKNQQKPKLPPKQQQLHYCDICKISCAGPQTYKEHLEGQKHKKKESAGKTKPEAVNSPNAYHCQLCDVTCTGADAYAAHLKGAKHQKVVNLHKKMGKPIPEIQPPKAPEAKDTKEDDKNKANKNNNRGRNLPRRPAAPKINFIGGTKLTTTGVVKAEASSASSTSSASDTATKDDSMDTSGEGESKFDLASFTGIDKTKIVGSDYLEEIKNDEGKVVNFHCKLCECKFNDPNAKDAHLAGRRHRLQYKKKVQPDLVVENKPSTRRLSKSQEDKLRRQWEQENYYRWRRGDGGQWGDSDPRQWEDEEGYRRMEEEQFWEEEQRRRYEAECFDWPARGGPHPPGPHPSAHLMDGPPAIPPPRPRYDSPDDRMVMMKHGTIYPNEQELQTVQSIVSASEKALKFVSDVIASEDNPQMEVESVEVKKEEDATAQASATPATTEAKEEADKPAEAAPENEGSEKMDAKQQPPRALKGVMRVGVLAKGLLLHERLDVYLVVLCHDKPTKTLLKRVSDNLPSQLEKVTEEKYEVKLNSEESTVTVCTTSEPKVTVTVTLTSPVMRDTEAADDGPEVLDRQKCLDALASLRHAKWFQAKANGLQSCVVIIRVMRDLCERVPTFAPLNKWALELLVEKTLSSSEQPLGPGEAFRRIMECISSGIFLEGGPGLNDYCKSGSLSLSLSGFLDGPG